MNLLKEKVLQEKQQIIEEIKDKVNNAQSVVLVDYRGLKVDELTELRRQYREAGVDYKVYKNTMMRLPLKKQALKSLMNI